MKRKAHEITAKKKRNVSDSADLSPAASAASPTFASWQKFLRATGRTQPTTRVCLLRSRDTQILGVWERDISSGAPSHSTKQTLVLQLHWASTQRFTMPKPRILRTLQTKAPLIYLRPTVGNWTPKSEQRRSGSNCNSRRRESLPSNRTCQVEWRDL